MTIEVYTTKTCPYCFAAKDLLQKNNMPYKEYDVSFNPEMRKTLLTKTGLRTVPQIYINGEHVGGFTDLVQHFLANQ